MADALEPETLHKLRAVLETRLEELAQLNAQAEDASATVQLDQTKVGRLSRMDAMQNQAISQATIRRRLLSIKAMRAALERMDAGEFGVCLECDERINPKRVELDPSVTLCIDCASRAELGE